MSENVTQPDSSTEEITPVGEQPGSATEASQTPPAKPPTEEEVAFNALSGSAQERFRAILKEREDYRAKLDQLEQAIQDRKVVENQQPTPAQDDDEVRKAIQKLRESGMATKDDLNALWFALRKEETHKQLESQYNGSDGLPKYDRLEVEDYANRHGFGANYLAAYREMYWDELTDAKVVNQRKGITTEKPTAVAEHAETLTLQKLREGLRGPNAQEYYDKLAKNPEQFNKLLEQLTSEE